MAGSARKPDRSTIIRQLEDLGVEKGDTLFVAADLLRVGYFNQSPAQTLQDWMNIFDEILGDTGTFVVPTYSPIHMRLLQKYSFVFTVDSESNSGSLAKAILNHAPGAIRGRHPTNSCTSKGYYAEEIASIDGPEYPKYSPYAKVVELGGKNLMLGIVDERNSPFTYHHVQELLGHTKTHPLCGLIETSYIDENGEKRRFIVREAGGCTAGVHKAWGYHLAQNAVKFSRVGRSLSALVDAQKSTEILLEVMTSNPHLLRCDNKACISCYGRFRYNGWGAFWYYPSQFGGLADRVRRKIFCK